MVDCVNIKHNRIVGIRLLVHVAGVLHTGARTQAEASKWRVVHDPESSPRTSLLVSLHFGCTQLVRPAASITIAGMHVKSVVPTPGGSPRCSSTPPAQVGIRTS